MVGIGPERIEVSETKTRREETDDSLPAAVTWRNRRYEIVECVHHEKQSSPQGGAAGGERYLRRQVFVVRLHTGQTATLYVQRQAPRGASPRAAKHRWFLYSIEAEPHER